MEEVVWFALEVHRGVLDGDIRVVTEGGNGRHVPWPDDLTCRRRWGSSAASERWLGDVCCDEENVRANLDSWLAGENQCNPVKIVRNFHQLSRLERAVEDVIWVKRFTLDAELGRSVDERRDGS
jgi:hypothetical protein